MDLAGYALRNQVVSALMTLLLLFGGYYAYTQLPRFEDPEFLIRQAQIVTPYPGASSAEVAAEVTDPLESALQELRGVKEVTSISTPGASEISIEFEISAAPDRIALNERFTKMRAKVSDAGRGLPPGAGPSMVFDDFGDVYGLYYAITGDGYSLNELYEYAKDLQQELVLVDGVSKVVLSGAPTEIIYIEYSPTRLARLGVSSGQIAQVLEGQNLIEAAGTVTVGDARIEIRPKSAIDSVTAIENLVIANAQSGASFHLKDIASVRRGTEDPPGRRLFSSGEPAIGIAISNRIGGNIVKMGEAIRARIAELESQRPLGIELTTISDQSVSVKESVDGFVMNVVLALAIVVGVLVVFMGLRSGVLMGGILLVTVAGTLIGMYLGGLDLQRISLGALIIALGMLVDNAVVVVEGALVKVEQGEDPGKAAVDVVNRTKIPLLGGTVIGLLAFSPIGFSPDNTGEYAGSLFWTITISLLFSWVVAVWLTPWYCKLLLKKPDAPKESREGVLLRAYRASLDLLIRFRWFTVAGIVGMFAVAISFMSLIPPGFFPASTRAQFAVDYSLPPETDSRRTAADLREIAAWLREQPGVTGTRTSVGGGHQRFMLTYEGASPEDSYGQVLVDTESFDVITDAFIRDIRLHLEASYPDAEPKVWKFVLGPGGGAKIQARFSGPDPAVLRALSEEAEAIFTEAGAVAVRNDWRDQIKTIRPRINETAARRVGLSQSDIAKALNQHFDGARVGQLREGDELRTILFRPYEEFREGQEDLRSVMIHSSVLGRSIPISQVVDGYDMVFETYKMRRADRATVIRALADPAEGVNSGDLYEEIRPRVEEIDLPPGYELVWEGEAGDSAEAQSGLASTFPFGFGAMALVVFLLFNAVRQPAIIWAVVPLAMIGVVAGLVLTQSPMDFMAILAVLSLFGMMIKNSIVLIDEIDEQIAGGKARMAALLDSTVSRVRPVGLGVLTTVLGVIPLLPDVFFRSLAVVIIFGLSFATVLTLIIVPVLYAIFFRIRRDEVKQAEAPEHGD